MAQYRRNNFNDNHNQNLSEYLQNYFKLIPLKRSTENYNGGNFSIH
jgi:hypothetical protein